MVVVHRLNDTDGMARLYESDYQRWLFQNAALLRSGRLSEVDAQNVAEELEDMGRSESCALGSHLAVLQLHLLKWQYQRKKRSTSWRASICNARFAVADLLSDSPSLRNRLSELTAKGYRRARVIAAIETELPEQTFPEQAPYPIDALLADDFWPD